AHSLRKLELARRFAQSRHRPWLTRPRWAGAIGRKAIQAPHQAHITAMAAGAGGALAAARSDGARSGSAGTSLADRRRGHPATQAIPGIDRYQRSIALLLRARGRRAAACRRAVADAWSGRRAIILEPGARRVV